MHILFLTDNFPPECNAPATRTYEHAIHWLRFGHRVTIITGAPNFPEGEVYEGYKNQWFGRENMDGIRVIRVKTYITANDGFTKRILDYLSFMVSSFAVGLFQKKPDIIVATSPQFFTAVSGWALAALRRKPFVFELRDIWPASITAVGAMKESRLLTFLEKIEIFLYRKASRIISVTESFKRELSHRGIDPAKIDVVMNGVELARYTPHAVKSLKLAAQHGLNGKFVAGYIGTHGMAHCLEHIVDAAQLLQHRDDIRFIFAGGGAAREQVERYAQKKRLNNVVLIRRQPKEVMPKIWSLCDLSLVSLRNVPLFASVIPSKIFESMGMGIPLVLSMPKGEATEIVLNTGSGVVVNSESPALLAAAIEQLCDDQAKWQKLADNSGVAAKRYSREHMAVKMIESFEKACM